MITTFDYSSAYDKSHPEVPVVQIPYPQQENCDKITARKLCGAGPSVSEIFQDDIILIFLCIDSFSKITNNSKCYNVFFQGGDWAVVKVTPLMKPLGKEFDFNINFCSPFSKF